VPLTGSSPPGPEWHDLRSMTARRRSGFALLPTTIIVTATALVLASCGPDGPDVYTAPVATAGESAGGPTAATAPRGSDPVTTASTAATGASVPPNGEVVDVRALDNSFIDEVVEVAAGTEIQWQNRGRNDHDVVPVDESQDWGVELESFTPGDSYSHVFTTPGTYRYFCTIHGTEDVGMIGTIVVS